jgi:2-amino-4-hydroxy-6-hydroxymethyldihydropteridine diphosphokinase
MRVGIGLGSNLGARTEELALARTWLQSLDPGARFSGIYETEAVDCLPSTPAFLNQAAEIRWNGSLTALLDLLQAHERSRGRRAVRGRNQARTLDLDLLHAGQTRIQTPRLRLPHPRMGGRKFVMEPLADLCPGRRIPGMPGTVRETAKWLSGRGRESCRRIG